MVNDDGGNCYMCYEDMSVNELKRRIKFINTLLRQPGIYSPIHRVCVAERKQCEYELQKREDDG